MKQKKAQASALVDFYAYIAFALVILIFFFLFKFGVSDSKKFVIEDEKTNSDATTVLLNYLRTPVVVDGKEITVADLIVLWNAEPIMIRMLDM